VKRRGRVEATDLESGSEGREESTAKADANEADVHQLKDHGRIRSTCRSADQLEHQDGDIVVESYELKSKKGTAGELAFSVRSHFFPCCPVRI
jgi:hypothetical protein